MVSLLGPFFVFLEGRVSLLIFFFGLALEDDILDLLTSSVVDKLSRGYRYINELFPNDDYQPPPHADRKKKWIGGKAQSGALPMQVHRKPVGQKTSRVKSLQKLASNSSSVRR